jgi:hypothetical protein
MDAQVIDHFEGVPPRTRASWFVPAWIYSAPLPSLSVCDGSVGRNSGSVWDALSGGDGRKVWVEEIGNILEKFWKIYKIIGQGLILLT